MGVLLFHVLSQREGWSDIQRLTNPAFGMMTRFLFDTHPDDLRDFWLQSGAALLRHIDAMSEGLRVFRTLIAEQDKDALAQALDTASAEYEKWINRRVHNRWDQQENKPELPTAGSLMGNMFGRLPFRRGDDDDDKRN